MPGQGGDALYPGLRGGLGLRAGYRSRGPFYLGASFQLSRLNSSNLLRLGILQRLTADGRYYFDRGDRLTPYLTAGVGGAIYGNEFRASSGGVALTFGVGLEYQISERTVVTLLPAYEPILFRQFFRFHGARARGAGPLGFWAFPLAGRTSDYRSAGSAFALVTPAGLATALPRRR